jgi:hypothetical protein
MQMFSRKERETQAGDSVGHRLLTLEETRGVSGGTVPKAGGQTSFGEKLQN